MKPTLLVLAAGMGSRYGGLKQMDAFGPSGETILDYSIYDAIQSGFGKVVFVIRESFNEAFRAFFSGKFDDLIEVEYVFQDITDVPEGSSYTPDREKPWGTAHAVWVARHVINEPFAVINADDFYGRGAYREIKSYFDQGHTNYSLVGYQLSNTLSDHGTVNRGVCQVNETGQLKTVVETLKIGFEADGTISYPTEDGSANLAAETVVSMNFWGFTPDYFSYAEDYFKGFLSKRGHEPKSEFFIPLLIEDLIQRDEKSVEVLSCDEHWFGVTYQEDKPIVVEKIMDLLRREVYPKKLWG
ncbi:MAG: sugar phosphate nucleotidyltransferase [Bacteroidota bacterium]